MQKAHNKNSLNYIGVFIGIVIIWQIIAVSVNIPILPTPINIIHNLIFNYSSEITIHILYSIRRIMIGLLIAIIIALPIGILAGFYKGFDKIVSPILYFTYPIPKFALLPIIMLILGIGEASKITMVVIIILFPMIVNIRDCIRSMDKEIYEPYYSIGANTYHIIIFITIKGILPSLFTSLRIGIGTALSVLFFAENFGTQYGIGYYIMDAWMRINYVDMYSGIILISGLGLFFFLIIDILSRRLCSWQKK
ncbi:MAG: ABC transporter permease subunit [Vallitalea sp.]|jgi:NitT/TauT family transport system permease protein|nr:ABC transporter permease subunit [Vallitalea sp.]